MLDLGCGTGTLTIILKQRNPGSRVVGLDGDPEILRLADQKARSAGVEVERQRGMCFEPPFPPASFDRVVSSLVFHHLTTEDKRRTFQRVLGLLKPRGELHLLDWGQAGGALMRVAFLPVQLLDGFKTTNDNVRGRLVPLMREAGFVDVLETRRRRSLLGTLSLYQASAPGGSN